MIAYRREPEKASTDSSPMYSNGAMHSNGAMYSNGAWVLGSPCTSRPGEVGLMPTLTRSRRPVLLYTQGRVSRNARRDELRISAVDCEPEPERA